MNSSPSTKDWKPVIPSVIRDEDLRDQLHLDGYAVLDFLDEIKVAKLHALYAEEHQLENKDGGMFYSVYSRDTAYRKRVHEAIGDLINTELEERFTVYKNVLNSFVIKAPGPKSGFALHQDTTALDEFKYTGVSVWIALQDIGPENGCMHIIPGSHYLSSPYRAITLPFPFQGIQEQVREFLQPVRLKAGQALMFDQRIIHDSSVNTSDHDRVAVLSGIFPEGAEFITCFKDQSNPENPIELHRHNANYLMEYAKFFYDCHDRPDNSEMLGTVPDDFPEISLEQFESFCSERGIKRSDQAFLSSPQTGFISEPVPDQQPALAAEASSPWWQFW